MNKNKKPILLKYIPHGLNHKTFKPIIESDNEWGELVKFKNTLFGGIKYDFVLFFNSRNIRRKQIPDAMLAYKIFIDGLPTEKAKKCAFLLHTEIVSDNGTDLIAVQELLLNGDKYNVIFNTNPYSPSEMNLLYNCSDAQILLSSNEGWGLSLTESLLVGNPIIANVTGGMQDQMGFLDENKNLYIPSPEIPSNNTGTYPQCGEWAFPVFPTSLSIQGSPPTPYIFDDRCQPRDAANQIRAVYDLGVTERKRRGLLGRDWAVNSVGFTGEIQGERVIECIDKLFEVWEPRERFELINVNTYPDRKLNHEL